MFGYTLVQTTEIETLRRERDWEARAAASRADACAALRAHLATAREAAAAAAARSEAAERTVQLQARSIEQLMASNERMVNLVSDMRRTGFGILEPIEVNDTPATVAQYDREAVEGNPDLEADDDL